MPRPRRSAPRRPRPAPEVGLELELEIGPVAHGGHCVARHEGRVVFVRHALPGEVVRARVTEGGKFWRADAIEVLAASPDRVAPLWAEAGPGRAGAAELQHVALPAQRRWKQDVIAEQFRRLARMDVDVVVEPTPGETDGWGWRTRMEYVVGRDGAVGMHRFRSHDVEPMSGHAPLGTTRLAAQPWPGATARRIHWVDPSAGDPVVLADGQGPTFVHEQVGVHRFRVASSGFWQVHREAPAVLTNAVLGAVGDIAGGRVLDLYSGAGLFTVPLAAGGATVTSIEGNRRAVEDAAVNTEGVGAVDLHTGSVDEVLAALSPQADVVVLDPPRAGAGRPVVDAVAATGAARLVYVACDPAALARDVAWFGEHGYALTSLRAHDLFPMTSHVECVALLVKSDSGLR